MPAYPKIILPLLVSALTLTSVAACSKDDGPESVLDKFLSGMPKAELSDVPIVQANGSKVANDAVTKEIKDLQGSLADDPSSWKRQKVTVTGESATAEVAVEWTLPGGTSWQYTTTVRMSKAKDGWRVIWEPTVVYPEMVKGEYLDTHRSSSGRAGVLAADGQEIIKLRPVVVIGVEPQRVTNIDKLVSDLDRIFKSTASTKDVSVANLAAQVKGAKPDAFVEIVTLRREIYDPIRNDLRALIPQTVFREEQWMLAPSRNFARQLLGTAGPVTKEIMDANPGVYQAGDQAGLGGLQRRYDAQLRGVSGITVVKARKAADGTVTETQLKKFDARSGTPLKTTLDVKVQTAAENALALFPGYNSSLVAIKVSDGSILAAANNKTDNNLAFTAQVPPGSTMKTVSALGLLENGKVTADQVVNCPKFLTVGGKQFKNSNNFELGAVPFHVDFAQSCNTAFASLAPAFGSDGLSAAGAKVGLGVPWDLGADVFSGTVSKGGDATEQAAAIFGQGKTVVSPVAMAGVAAAVARGQWKQPVLLLDPKPAKPAADGPQLKQATLDQLRAMMGEVVTSGTAAGYLTGTKGGTVFGKTGTAEFDNNPDHTHAWFIGYQGDVAFAVFVELGLHPQDTALPITKAFLNGI